MIPRAHVTAWRSRAPWPDDALVEQDLLLSRALVEIFSDGFLVESLAFRGGTALHKLFLEPAPRFSEDIDLVQLASGPIGPIMRAIHDRLHDWLGAPRTKLGEGRATMQYRFEPEMQPAGLRRLKVEINTREHFRVLGLRERIFTVSSPWFEGSASITTYALEEILGTKLRALYQRKKGRDLFDLDLALRRLEVDELVTVQCCQRYLQEAGAAVSRAQFEQNLASKITDPAFAQDVEPILRPGMKWDIEAALRNVSTRLVAHLPGEPWKGHASA